MLGARPVSVGAQGGGDEPGRDASANLCRGRPHSAFPPHDECAAELALSDLPVSGSLIAEAYGTSQCLHANLSISLDYPISFVIAMNCASG